MNKIFFISLTLMPWTSLKAQNPNNFFEASKGTWRFPISTVKSIDTTMTGCLGERSNSLALILKAEYAQEVRAIWSGEVRAVAELGGIEMVIIKTGEYFLVYYGLAETRVRKGEKVERGSIIGTLTRGDDDKTFDLELMLYKQSQALNINRWFDWKNSRN